MLQNAREEQEQVQASQIFDQIVVNDDIRDTLDEVKEVISKFRPDIIPPKEEAKNTNTVKHNELPMISDWIRTYITCMHK